MSKELQDALARHLLAAYCAWDNRADSRWDRLSDPAREMWLHLAREVLRQMEWVRDQCWDCVGGAAEGTSERIDDLKLTLAPPDWKPPTPRGKAPSEPQDEGFA